MVKDVAVWSMCQLQQVIFTPMTRDTDQKLDEASTQFYNLRQKPSITYCQPPKINVNVSDLWKVLNHQVLLATLFLISQPVSGSPLNIAAEIRTKLINGESQFTGAISD